MRYAAIITALFLSSALAAPLALESRADAVKTVQGLQDGVAKTVSTDSSKRDDYGYDYGYDEKPKHHAPHSPVPAKEEKEHQYAKKPEHEAPKHESPKSAPKKEEKEEGSPLGGILPKEDEKENKGGEEGSPLGGIMPKEEEKRQESPLGNLLPKEEEEEEDKKGDKEGDNKGDNKGEEKDEEPNDLGDILGSKQDKRTDGPLDPIAKPIAKAFGASDEELNEKRYEIMPEEKEHGAKGHGKGQQRE